MKSHFILYLLTFLLYSCNPRQDKVINHDNEISNINQLPVIDKSIEKESIDLSDTLISKQTFDIALEIANRFKKQDSFTIVSDSLEIHFGNIISELQKHLIIKRFFDWNYSFDIFLLEQNNFQHLVSKELNTMTYINDTLMDINGDNRLDFYVYSYSLAGCCLRHAFEVFIQDPNGKFSEEFLFMNPSFDPKSKIVRGISYGHFPPYYKYKWNGNSIDTIEYLFIEETNDSLFYVKRNGKSKELKGDTLRFLPEEYQNISMFWK